MPIFQQIGSPNASAVAAVQAKIQLSRMPHDGSVVPGATELLTATQKLVDGSGDIELVTWFDNAQTWKIDNPNVQKIASVFRLTAEGIQKAFNDASKIQE